jgi:hypothetical protein
MEATIPVGSVHGGQQPIQGAHVYVFAANLTGGYGSASQSLITGGDGTDSIGSYVLTDGNGGFHYGGTATCPAPTSQIYLLATGGNPTGQQGGPVNTAIALTAALGSCSTINSSTFTSMNEVTTVAMAFALKSFMVDGSHVGSRSTNFAGLRNAFANVANLVDNTTGTALAQTPGGNGVAPQDTLNTLANVIAPCVNSGGSDSAPCTQLFSQTGVTGTTPTVLDATLSIASVPAAQPAALYADALATAPFQPALVTQPHDFSLGITFHAPTTTVQPGPVVIDASGNIWMASCKSCLTSTAPDALVEYSPAGVVLHTYTGSGNPATQVLHQIKGIAIDAAGSNIYTLNQGIGGGSDQLIKMSTTTGAVQGGFPVNFSQGTYGVDNFNGIAIDTSGEIWATATTAGAVVELNSNGNVINGFPDFIGGATGIGVDNVGNIWFAGTDGQFLAQFATNGDFLSDYTPPGLNQPINIAINDANEIWTINTGDGSLSKIEFFNGANAGGSPYTTLGLFKATVTAIDGANQVLIPNCRASCLGSGSPLLDNLLRLSQSGVPNNGASGTDSGVQIATFSGASGAAVDASGNVWVSNSVSGNLTQVIGYAAPTIQPLALAASNGTIGQLP